MNLVQRHKTEIIKEKNEKLHEDLLNWGKQKLQTNYKEFFSNQHDVVCNQKYRELPYSFHLQNVANFVDMFYGAIENSLTLDKLQINAIAWGHDSIEDARLSYNDIRVNFGDEVAECIRLCTENSRGRNRDERKDEQFYKELSADINATFVKLCDICANWTFSIATASTMQVKYQKEYKEKVRPLLYRDELKIVFNFLDKLCELL